MLLGAPVAAQAQTYEFGLNGGRTSFKSTALGTMDANQQGAADDDIKLFGEKYSRGARVTANWWRYYGLEAEYSRMTAKIQAKVIKTDADTGDVTSEMRYDKVNVSHLSVNFLSYLMPKDRRWRPFITGGGGRTTFGSPSFSEWLVGSSVTYGVNYGGGIKLLPTRHTLIRIDVRQYITGKPYDPLYVEIGNSPGRITFFEAQIGASITF